MSFEVRFNSIQPSFEGRNSPLLLELVFRNTVNRQARLLNYQLELWHQRDFLGALRPDLHNKGQPMQWNIHDSEVCLLCTHSILAYMAGI